jgi:hypothetical protein
MGEESSEGMKPHGRTNEEYSCPGERSVSAFPACIFRRIK